MIRVNPNIAFSNLKCITTVSANCPDCGHDATVYENGHVRCSKRKCAGGPGRSKLWAPQARRDPVLWELLQGHREKKDKRKNGNRVDKSQSMRRGGNGSSQAASA
jgi:hypothetical protein